MKDIVTQNNLISIIDGEPMTTSLALAEGTGVQHKNVMELIRNYLDDLQQFGGVAFQTRPFETAGGIQKREIANLNEPQSTLIMTYMKNTEIVRTFKMALVKGFFEAREMLRNSFDPAKMSRGDILRLALDAEEENQKLTAKIEADKPKVEFAEKHAKADGWVSLREAAKQLGQPPIAFNRWLHSKNYMYKTQSGVWLPYSDAQKRGFLDVKSTTITGVDGVEKVRSQCMVTAKGIQHFTKLLEKAEATV